jgi:hypothetical protein
MYPPEYPADKVMTSQEAAKGAHLLSEYYDVWGGRPRIDNYLENVEPDSYVFDDFYKEEIAYYLSELTAEDAKNQMKYLEDELDIGEGAKLVEKWTKGKIKAKDILK